MAMMSAHMHADDIKVSSRKFGSDWWLSFEIGGACINAMLTLAQWRAIVEACYAPTCDMDQAFQALADRDQTPPPDADNVGGPAPAKDDGAPLEIDEGDYLPGSDPLRM